MIERLSAMSPRGKGFTLAALVVMIPVGGWIGYNLGHWMATH